MKIIMDDLEKEKRKEIFDRGQFDFTLDDKDKELWIKVKIKDPVLATSLITMLRVPRNIDGFENLGFDVLEITNDINKEDVKEQIIEYIKKM